MNPNSNKQQSFSFRFSFFYVCNEALSTNPISHFSYVGLEALEGILQLILPFLAILDQELVKSVTQRKNITVFSTLHEIVFYLTSSLQLAIALLLLTLTVYFYLRFNRLIKWKKEIIQEKNYAEQSLGIKYSIQLIMILLVVFYKIILYVGMLCYFIFIKEYLNNENEEVNKSQDVYLKILSMFFAASAFGLSVVFEYFFTPPFPEPHVPWSKDSLTYPLLFNFHTVLYSFTFALPLHLLIFKFFIIATFCYQLFVFTGSIIYLRSYSLTISRVQICKSSFALVSSMVMMADSFIANEDISHSGQLTYFVIASISLFLACRWMQDRYFLRKMTSGPSRTLSQVFERIGLILMMTSVKEGEEKEIEAKMNLLKSLYFDHFERCAQEDCPCHQEDFKRRFPPVDLATAEAPSQDLITLNIDYRNKKDLRVIKENLVVSNLKNMQMSLIIIVVEDFYNVQVLKKKRDQQLELYLVWLQLILKENLFQNYYQLLTVHNCKLQHCTVSSCYLTFSIKVKTLKTIRKAEKAFKSEVNFEHHLQFQVLFVQYIEVVNECTQELFDYWKHLAADAVEVATLIQKQTRIQKKYLQFKAFYQVLLTNLGQSLLAEGLAYKLHSAALNFEVEAEDNLRVMCNIDMAERSQMSIMRGANDYSKMDGRFGLVVVSINPTSFQRIYCVNKYFCLLTKFTEEELRGKITIVMPHIISENHEYLMRRYIDNLSSKFIRKNTEVHSWLKHKNSSISPVQIKTQLWVSLENELNLIGIVNIPQRIKIHDQQLQSKSVFFILTDQHDQMIHLSENCHTALHISSNVIDNQVLINEIFPGIFQLQIAHSEEDYFETSINLDSSYIVVNEMSTLRSKRNRQLEKLKSIKVQIQKFLHTFGDENSEKVIFEYRFVLLKEATIDNNTLPTFFPKNYDDSHSLQDSYSQKAREEALTTPKFVHIEGSSDEDQEMEGSVTSASASSSSRSTSNFREVKGVLNLTTLPTNLKRLKWNIMAFFAVLIITAFALLFINLASKDDFHRNLILSEEILTIRNRLESAKLDALYIYTIANNDRDNFTQFYNTNHTLNDTLPWFVDWLSENVEVLQEALNNITSTLYQQSENLIELFSEKKIEMQSLSSSGSIKGQNASLTNSLEQIIIKADGIIKSSYEGQQVPHEIYGITIEHVGELKGLNDMSKRFYFILLNSLSKLGEVLKELDDEFIKGLFENTDIIMKGILITTLICSFIIFLVSTILIPYVNRLDRQMLKMLEMQLNISTEQKVSMNRKISNFLDFLSNGLHLLSKNELHNSKFYNDEQAENQEDPELSSFTKSFQRHQQRQQLPESFQNEEIKEGDKSQNQSSLQLSESHDNIKPDMTAKKGTTKMMKQKHKKGRKHKDQKIFDDDDSDQKQEFGQDHKQLWTLKNSRQLQALSFSGKVRKALYVYLFASLICGFYTGSYFLSKTMFSEFIEGFEYASIFYERKPCISNAFFMIQLEYFEFEILVEEEGNAQEIVEKALDQCNEEELEYWKLLQAKKRIFRSIQEELEMVNTEELCQFMIDHDIHNETCEEDLDGFYKLGLNQIIQAYLKHVNQRKVYLNSILESNQDTSQAKMQALFFEEKSFSHVLTFFKHIQQVLGELQYLSEQSVLNEVQRMFDFVVAIFSTFIVLMLVLVVLAQKILIGRLHAQMMRTHIGMKIIPGDEFIRLKQELNEEEQQKGLKGYFRNLGKL